MLAEQSTLSLFLTPTWLERMHQEGARQRGLQPAFSAKILVMILALGDDNNNNFYLALSVPRSAPGMIVCLTFSHSTLKRSGHRFVLYMVCTFGPCESNNL